MTETKEANEKAEFWREESKRYDALAASTDGDVSHGYRVMARDAQAFANAFTALAELATLRAQLAGVRERVDAMCNSYYMPEDPKAYLLYCDVLAALEAS